MAGRRSVWSDSRLIDLAKQFVPTTDEVWRLQGTQDNDANIFQEMANKGHYRKVGGSRQGIYVCTPKGNLLSSINSLNADVVLNTIKIGLEKWHELPLSERRLPDDHLLNDIHRWENSYPDHGLVLTSYNIDLFTDPPTYEERSDRWNIDHVWFNQEESRQWLPNRPKVGDIYDLPEKLTDRLFRFHLVDNVRGQTLPFAPAEIKSSSLQVEIVEYQKDEVRIKITGSSKAIAKGEWLLGENDWTPTHLLDHSMETNLLGEAIYDLALEKFIEFEMVAIGHQFGKTQNNGRKHGTDSNYIGFLFKLSQDRTSDRIAPAFVDLYNADWIVHPDKTM